jgi:hypothetical protein
MTASDKSITPALRVSNSASASDKNTTMKYGGWLGRVTMATMLRLKLLLPDLSATSQPSRVLARINAPVTPPWLIQSKSCVRDFCDKALPESIASNVETIAAGVVVSPRSPGEHGAAEHRLEGAGHQKSLVFTMAGGPIRAAVSDQNAHAGIKGLSDSVHGLEEPKVRVVGGNPSAYQHPEDQPRHQTIPSSLAGTVRRPREKRISLPSVAN